MKFKLVSEEEFNSDDSTLLIEDLMTKSTEELLTDKFKYPIKLSEQDWDRLNKKVFGPDDSDSTYSWNEYESRMKMMEEFDRRFICGV